MPYTVLQYILHCNAMGPQCIVRYVAIVATLWFVLGCIEATTHSALRCSMWFGLSPKGKPAQLQSGRWKIGKLGKVPSAFKIFQILAAFIENLIALLVATSPSSVDSHFSK